MPEAELHATKAYYISHHGVYNPNKPQKRMCVLFDCGAKFAGSSLDDTLLQGPDMTNSLVGVLCRFRLETYAFMYNVEKMFYMFKVNKEHCDYLKFLWWKNGNTDSEVIEYRMTVHLFDASSSLCANFGQKQIAYDAEKEFGQATNHFICEDFYVDDGLKATKTEQEAKELIENNKQACTGTGLLFNKFVLNSEFVLNSIAAEDKAESQENLELLQGEYPLERALGIQWCVKWDTFRYRITLRERPLTRRGILSTVSIIYDPLGFLSPSILVGKQILQDMCRENYDWDTVVSDGIKERWESWKRDALKLDSSWYNGA